MLADKVNEYIRRWLYDDFEMIENGKMLLVVGDIVL